MAFMASELAGLSSDFLRRRDDLVGSSKLFDLLVGLLSVETPDALGSASS